jgi:hypothetical protein
MVYYKSMKKTLLASLLAAAALAASPVKASPLVACSSANPNCDTNADLALEQVQGYANAKWRACEDYERMMHGGYANGATVAQCAFQYPSQY